MIIQAIATLPAYRRFGIATKLIEYLAQTMRDFKPSLLETKPLELCVPLDFVPADQVFLKSCDALFTKCSFSKGSKEWKLIL